MQQKRGRFKGIIITLIAVLIIAGIGILMSRDIAAPQQPVEKQLDAKAFLEQKQP